MNRFQRFAGTAFVAAIVAAAVGPGTICAAHAQDAPPGDVAKGKQLYLAQGCFTCHGRSGQGGALNGPAPSLAKTEMPFEGFAGQLREPAKDMPAYSKALLSDQDVADIYAYVESLPGPRSPKDIPILNN
jgi:mono/diheme cytochrome c family protein